MSMYRIRKEFSWMCRTGGLTEFDPLRDNWINQGWRRITELFVIPSLTKTLSFDAVADQQAYFFPYDYNGTEIGLKYNNRRLDPYGDEHLTLKYERRSGSLGSVWFYDWSGVSGSDLFQVTDCTLTNNSSTVQCSSTDTRLNEAYWVRFDPYVDSSNAEREDDTDNMVDPGDYGYLISAGGQVSGTSFQLTQAYRGPDGASFTARIRPAEQQRFITYGIPATSESDAFELKYSAQPRRLYNDADTPEWPSMEIPIAYMALSSGLEWHHNMELASTFWGRAMQRIKGLERRRKRVETLVSDMTIGSVVGRRTGARGVFLGSSWSRRRYR